MENENVQPEVVKTTQETQTESISLSDAERNLIEAQRLELERMEVFKKGYQELVQRTGFAWGVDGNSPLSNPQLGIGRVK